MKNYFFYLLLSTSLLSFSQQEPIAVMTLTEYLGYVKNYHPIVKQANLVINNSEAKLLKARGAFDPKIEVDFDKKQFKEKEYYNKLNAAFKVPTWYGVELKANLEDNQGIYLNPENNVPLNGLYSAGVSVSLAKNLLINKRMADLKKARFFLNQAKEDQQILVNEILYNASLTYFNWLKTYNEKKVYESFLENAKIRFNGTKRAFIEGDKPAIDTLEAGITLKTRKLNLEKSRIKLVKSTLEISTFLWLNDNTPVELKETITPDTNAINTADSSFNISLFNNENFDINEHPKIKSLSYKMKSLTVDKKLKTNNLLPQIDLQYNFLTQTPEQANSLIFDNYKAGINVVFPLFLRKERGDLKLAKIKLKDVALENETTKVMITNKVNTIEQELASYILQISFLSDIVTDYNTLLAAEDRKFFLGESSLFLVNYREVKFIEAKLKAIELENTFLKTKASLFNALGVAF